MEMTVTLNDTCYALDLAQPHDLSIPIRFDGPQLCVFGSATASCEPLQAGGFLGNVARGGSCNCDILHFCAHTNGTHTECVGHITREPIAVTDILQQALIPATVITVTPVRAKEARDSYDPSPAPDDQLITAGALMGTLLGADPDFLQALIIRTLPNDDNKRTHTYHDAMPPYFTTEAMQLLLQHNVQHLLVDMPSIDRLADEGKLSNHRLFWGVPQGATELTDTPSRKTITELIYVQNTVADGNYMLNLGIAPVRSDASPSRPLLYKLERL